MKNSQKKVIEQWYILPLILVASSVSKLSLGQFGYNCVISFISSTVICNPSSPPDCYFQWWSTRWWEWWGRACRSPATAPRPTPTPGTPRSSSSGTRTGPSSPYTGQSEGSIPIREKMEIFKLIPITSRIAFSDWNSIMTVFSSAEVSPDRTLHLAAGSTRLIKF